MTRQEKINKVAQFCAASSCLHCKAIRQCEGIGYGMNFFKWSLATDENLDTMLVGIGVIDKPVEQQPITRAVILDTAKKCVVGDRQDDYGSPENSFAAIAQFWQDYIKAKYNIDIHLSAADTAAMMAAFKIARIATGHGKSDNWIDLAGYAACGGEIEANGN